MAPSRSRRSVALLAFGLLALGPLVAGCTSGAASTRSTRSPSTLQSGPTTSTPTVPSAVPSAAQTGAAQTVGRSVTVLGSGDVLIHPQLWEQAAADSTAAGKPGGYDFGPMYAGISAITRGVDLATCEMESPLAPPEGPFTGWPDFSSPPQVLTALKAVGYSSCTTASNHSIDQGEAGVTRTLNELDAAGLRHTGSARSAAEAAKPMIITTRNGVKIAQLAYAFGFNGQQLPAGKPWLANETDVPTILAAAHRAKLAGADIVVLSMHWGVEYSHTATALQQSEAAQLLASPDIDVILGDHPHVVEPFQQIHGKWVIYSMGNQISRHADPVPASREGVMPVFTFTEVAPHVWKTTRVQADVTWMQFAPAFRLIDVAQGLADPATTPAQRADLQGALTRVTGYVNAMGAGAAGLQVN
ncbi:poly-gamma-glutamate synthesis protein (capsule biosynthesis protein) [Frankineae bacterium MT45]|nr:poly-gamma-glutamate synthesis protein (capsule biosynthesis protein) [Frankineae bacterium MT45]